MTQDWTKGPLNAPKTLLEYGDFECPFCGQAYPELKRLEEAIGDQLLFVFRHFPLAQMHPHAKPAAEAAEAAGAQGRFWEMHNKLFENQDRLEADDLLAYAGELKLDLPRFVEDLETHRHAPKVRRDFLQGVRSGVNGTPTFFINGQRYNGPHTYEALLATLQGRAAPEIEPISRLPRAGL
jgi:protein-disulfide isomerase